MGKNREDQWKKFFQECYFEEYKRFQAAVIERTGKQGKEYIEQFKLMLKDFINSVKQYDYMIGRQIGSIEVSFLRQSMLSDKLIVAFEAFDERQELGDCVAGYQLEVDWFQEEIQAHKDRLLQARQNENWIREIREEDIYVMLQSTMAGFIRGMVGLFKYSLETFPLWEETQAFNRSKMFFFVSMGEYRDWQYMIYVERAEFDLLTINASDTCRYGKFEKCVYHEQAIENRDIRDSFFDQCTFEKTRFTGSKVTDCRFYDCVFYGCDLSGLDFTGAVFYNCKFDECNLQDIVWYDPTKTNDFFRKTCIGKTSFTRCGIDESAFSDCSVEGLMFDKGERCAQ